MRIAGPERLVSIDACRGFALVTIFINHVPGNGLEAFTHKNLGLSDAAELFVFLAGIATAFAYMPRFLTGDGLRQTVRLAQRAFKIYCVHLVVLLACVAIVATASLAMQDSRILDGANLEALTASPVEALIGFATLGLQPSYLNILPLYVVLMGMAPAFVKLVSVSRPLACCVSLCIYLLAQNGLGLPSYPGSDDTWFFNPFAWQLLFTIGLCCGSWILEGRAFVTSRWLLGLAVAYLVFGLVWRHAQIYPEQVFGLPRFLWDDDKNFLSAPRLLHVLALAYVAASIPLERLVRSAPGLTPLVWVGRHSLAVFGFGTMLAFVAQMVRIAEGPSWRIDVVLIGAGLLLQLGLAWLLEWIQAGRREPSRKDLARTEAHLAR